MRRPCLQGLGMLLGCDMLGDLPCAQGIGPCCGYLQECLTVRKKLLKFATKIADEKPAPKPLYASIVLF